MEDLIVIAVILAIVVSASVYIYKAKKRGIKCIGCPEGCSCGKSESGCCGCSGGCGEH